MNSIRASSNSPSIRAVFGGTGLTAISGGLLGLFAPKIRAKLCASYLATRCALDIGTAFGRDTAALPPFADRWRLDADCGSQGLLRSDNLHCSVEGACAHGRYF